jgi:predicted dehydrogenase
MLAENDVFRPSWTLIAELVADGRFDDVYYCRGERISRDTDKMEQTPWRRTWRGGRNGVTYPTHTFGPVLRWFPDERIDRLSCAGSGHHYVDPRGDEYEQEDTVVVLAKTDRDHLIVHRQDIISDRPAVPYRFELQGTAGCFESAAHPGDEHRIALSGETDGWVPLETFESALPKRWQERTERERQTGRDGGDYLLFEAFIDAIVADEPAPIDVIEGVEMTLPGLLSERSIAADGEWVDVPDPRSW